MVEAAAPTFPRPARGILAGNALPLAIFLVFALVPLFARLSAEVASGDTHGSESLSRKPCSHGK